jgi:hypothetical protein
VGWSGKYATPFSAGTASYDMFGDGRDGVMPSSGNLDYNNGVGVGIVNSGSAGSYYINVTDVYAVWRINPGDVVLIHQTQGTNAGCWELNKAVSDFGGGTATYQLEKPLRCNYASGGNNHAQIQRVPQYTDCPVSGTVTPLSAWNGSWGGIFAVMCNGTMNISGTSVRIYTRSSGALRSRLVLPTNKPPTEPQWIVYSSCSATSMTFALPHWNNFSPARELMHERDYDHPHTLSSVQLRNFYLEHVMTHLRNEFPGLVSSC